MTAKEQSEKALIVYELNGIIIYEYEFSQDEFKAFCEQLCREQREICQQIYYHQTNDLQRDLLTNIETAPMPEL